MKIFHSADWHLNEKDHDEIRKCLDFKIEKAMDENPDVFIISGDIFNSQYIGLDTKSSKTASEIFRKMSDIAPVAVIVGTPSHELMAPELLRNVSGKFPIHVSTTAEQIYLADDRENGTYVWLNEKNVDKNTSVISLVVSQVPPISKEFWKNRQGVEKDNQNIAEAMASIFANFGKTAKKYDCPHILSGHFSVQGCKISENQLLPGTDIAIGKENLSYSNADLVCLGHIHMAQEYELLNGKRAFHSGSIFRKDFGERKEDKGFYIHELIPAISLNQGTVGKKILKVESEFIKTPSREMHQYEFDFMTGGTMDDDFIPDGTSGAYSYNEIIMMSIAEGQDAFTEGSHVKIKLKMWIDDLPLLNQSQLTRDLTEAGAEVVKIEIDRVRRENSRDEEIIDAVPLIEKVKLLEERRSQPAPDGVYEMLEAVETMNPVDLEAYALDQISD